MDEALKSTAYFADPLISWQRVSNEKFNGLLPQYIPKKNPLAAVTTDELEMIQDRIYHQSRKRLGLKLRTKKVLHHSLGSVALRT